MDAWGKKAKLRSARSEALDVFEGMAEHYDLLWLWVLHRSKRSRYGAKRLRETYRDLAKMYHEYKRRYMTSSDSTVYGDRMDTYVLKRHLKEIGFDYDKECEAILKEMEQEKKCDSV